MHLESKRRIASQMKFQVNELIIELNILSIELHIYIKYNTFNINLTNRLIQRAVEYTPILL